MADFLMKTKKNVNPAEIEKGLASLWDSLHIENRQKACLFNFIIYTDDERRLQYFHKIVENIIATFPCRIFFIKERKEKQFSISLSVETMGSDEVAIPCDQITIESDEKNLEKIPFLLLSHLVSDLPIYLFWGKDPSLKSPIFPSLQKLSSRLIVDSESAQDFNLFCTDTLAYMKTAPCDLIDLNWIRFSGWRTVIAQVFSKELYFDELQECEKIEITYNGLSTEAFQHCVTQSLYLQGWLATQFQWKEVGYEEKGNQATIHYNKHRGKVVIELIEKEQKALPPGSIIKCKFTTKGGYLFHFSRNLENPEVAMTVSTDHSCLLPQTYYLPNIKRGLSFVKELFYAKPCSSFQEILQTIQHTGKK